MKAYNDKRSKEYIKAMNAKRNTTKEKRKVMNQRYYEKKKREAKHEAKNPAGIFKTLDINHLH